MTIIVTFTFIGQSKEDAMNMPAVFEAYREGVEKAKAAGVYGPPEAVTLRYLLKPGKWE